MQDISFIESSDHLKAKEVQWRTAIGRFILRFASIEWFTIHMLSELPTERILESTMGLRFGQRLDLVTQLLQEKDLDAELTAKAIALLKQARDLSKYRNLLAHNPLLLNFFDDKVGVDMEYMISKYGETEPRVTIDKLEELCKEAEALDDELLAIRQLIE